MMTALIWSAADRLRSGFRGQLIWPGDDGYDAARRVWNGAIDRRPALIARASGTGDVIAAVRFARENDLPVSVRGGGHSAAGHAVADGALMLDLSGIKSIAVDPAARTAVAGPGLVWSRAGRRHPGVRAGHHRRGSRLHRHRRADPRRRHRLSGPAGRADL